jgi:hypothetical protein
VPLVVVPVHRVAEEGSPELCRRAAPPRHASRRPRRVLAGHAALDVFVVSRATSQCDPCTKLSHLARSRGAPARPPQLATVRRCLLPVERPRASTAARSGFDSPDCFDRHRLSSSRRRPLDRSNRLD